MFILSVCFGVVAFLAFIWFLVTITESVFSINSLILIAVCLCFSFFSYSMYESLKTGETYIKYYMVTVDNDFYRISKKKCDVYAYGLDDCNVIEEILVTKENVFKNNK